MNNRITFHQVTERLGEHHIPYTVLRLQDNVAIVISQYGGRILGPFLSEEGESIYWVNSAFARRDSFDNLVASSEWNIGGERVWIGPEIQYFVRERREVMGTSEEVVQEQMDPGRHELDQPRPGQCRLCQGMTLDAYNLASGQKELHLERILRQADNPLAGLSIYHDIMDGVIYAGYEQVVTLTEAKLDDITSVAWNLIQLNPGGTILMPTAPGLEYVDYYEPIDQDFQATHSNYVSAKITGNRRYKVGYKAAHLFGRLAYLNHLMDEMYYLLIRTFFNNPSAAYLDEPAHSPGQNGASAYIYNDDGELGGFGELEYQAQTIGGATGDSSSTDKMLLWLYVGANDKIKRVAHHLLGIEL
jgi:hypothetical protein